MKNIPEIELLSAERIKSFQWEKVVVVLKYLQEKSPFYKTLFSAKGITLGTIVDWESFEKLPTTSKDDLQNHNWEFLCVDKGGIVEYTSTSGTLGKPVTIALTENDLGRLAYNESISFQCADGTSEDLYQLMLTLDRQFMAGIAYYEGIRKMGAGLIRVGPGLPALQWETIERLKPTALVAVPSFAVKLIEFAEQNGLNLNQSSVKKIICIGEPIRTTSFDLNPLGNRIRSSWNVALYGTYASTEMQTAFTECTHGVGGHLHPELMYVEILGDDDKPVPPGEAGEITITTLGVEGMPLLRYRTGDVSTAFHKPCACGRTSLRIGPILGRKQQMVKLKGTTLYPPAIFEILQQIDAVRDFVVEVFKGELETDELKLHILPSDGNQSQVDQQLRAAFQSRIRVVPEIKFVSAKEIEALQLGGGSRKVKKFIDNR
jgi:phenylacetate-CoA ligase